ncbi:HEAT repeat protein-like protein, partial [Lepidopterella palustris CBS 459.81]
MSRGPADKNARIKKIKGGTPSSRRHHFESFSQRISKITIDPVRRVRRTAHDDDELTTTFSYFHTSLFEWRDRNLSENFTHFARHVAPLCESLPQILHHDDRILELLVEYIEKRDIMSLEPLLSLVAHFAHDLGVRFEKHFARIVTTVSQVASKSPEAEVIEWSFTCLAWLFKYLSKLLVPDLRPLFDLMAPLLGKERQKPFVAKFAAESLSFLFRKAGAAYHRDAKPLEVIVKHILEDLEGLQDPSKHEQYQHGLMVLFVESIKGVQHGVHSSGQIILREITAQTFALMLACTSTLESSPAEHILTGVLVALIHHTNSEAFEPLLKTILDQIKTMNPSANVRAIKLSARLLFTVSGVRKGSRIEDWTYFLEVLDLLIEGASREECLAANHSVLDVLAAVAVAFQTCPLETAIPHVRILETFTEGYWAANFLPFCILFAEQGSERFNSFLFPHFKRFINCQWQTHREELCLILPRMKKASVLPPQSLSCPQGWQQQILDLCRHLARSEHMEDRLVYDCNGFLTAASILAMDDHNKTSIATELSTVLEKVLVTSNPDPEKPRNVFAVGHVLSYLIENGMTDQLSSTTWQSLCRVSKDYAHYLIFWKGLHKLVVSHSSVLDLKDTQMELLKDALVTCLGSPSHDLRLTALEIMSAIFSTAEESHKDILSTALLIEQSPLNIQTARSVSMHVRKLATNYKSICSDEWLAKAIPMFCFGLLHVKFAQLWEDSCVALKQMCETKEGETVVSNIAFNWVNSSIEDPEFRMSPSEGEVQQFTRTNEFDCSNLSLLTDMASRSQNAFQDASIQLNKLFDSQHYRTPFITSASRTQALRVLNCIPQVAEKRSRLLVPILLEWTSATDNDAIYEAPDTGGDEAEQESTTLSLRWARKDQKAMLSLFASFTNPTVLFRSSEVYSALLSLVGNGDLEIQKSALKAIMTWKNAGINRYEEHLFNLLDDARFREQISVFLDVGEEDSEFQEQHRAQLMPIILRLLYGKIVNRSGSASGKRGQEVKRKAVFIALTRFEQATIGQFLEIALGPLHNISIIREQTLNEEILHRDLLSPRKQMGLLNMMEDLLDTLGTTLTPFTSQIIDPLLYCLIRASRTIPNSSLECDVGRESPRDIQLSLLKSIRQTGLRSLGLLFNSCPEFSWQAYMPIIVQELVDPKLEKLPIQTAQSISGTLKLFATWARNSNTALFLAEYNHNILPKVAECLGIPSAKDEVKLFILNDILRSVIRLTNEDNDGTVPASKKQREDVRTLILQPYANAFLIRIGDLLRKNPSRAFLEVGVQSVEELASFVEGSSESRNMIEIAAFLLRQPSQRVNSRTKSNLLKILHAFIPRCDLETNFELFETICNATFGLFSFVQDRPSRRVLCEITKDLSKYQPDLQDIADLCDDLNSFSSARLDEPDFEKRSKAFSVINEDQYLSYSVKQWRPLVYNMLYYIKDSEELSIRVNASFSLRRFIECASNGSDAAVEDFKQFMTLAILPGIQYGVRESSELVRVEYLSVLAHIVRKFPDWPPVHDLNTLLAHDDEEASFFTNVLHIQLHRRARAVRRLAAEARSGKIASENINHFFIPLLEHFIFDKSDDQGAHNLAADSVATIGAMAEWLDWQQYKGLLVKFTSYITSKEEMLKTIIKLIGATMDSLSRAGHAKGYITHRSIEKTPSANDIQSNGTDMDIDIPQSKLSKSLPVQQKLSDDLNRKILPPLVKFLHDKDESTVSLRVPIAVAVTKILRMLPPEEFAERLPPVLMDVCHILRSKSQDARDMTRKTLAEISSLIGPAYFGFVLKELRRALQRGYQLHVLSFTMHSILLELSSSPTSKPGDLDYCLPSIVAIIMDDIFGVTGQEKDAEEYISKMKEVKKSTSFDSMEHVAKLTTLKHLVDLVRPTMMLLLERLDLKMVKKIDELLRRVGLGILHNAAVQDRDILVFCYELIKEVYKDSATVHTLKEEDDRTKRYLIKMKSASKSSQRGGRTSHIYKMTRFALDILRSVLRKHESLQTPENIAGFMPIIGDALVQGQEEVQLSAIKLLTAIIKVPLPVIDRNAPVYVSEAVQTINAAPSTNTELAQAALKLISAVLRERRNVTVKEKDLAYLLKKLKPDLEEPNRQGVTFNFLKAVMARKIVITEVYEVLDTVSVIMVTNQTRTARDLARSVYFQFLMEYPQGQERFSKQLEFLVKNLKYEHVHGRQSVMETLHLILTKVGDNLIQEVLNLVFIPLAMAMYDDDSSDCRAMAGALLKRVFERADAETTKSCLSILRTWLEQNEQPLLKRLALQCWTLYFEVAEGKMKDVSYVLDQLEGVLAEASDPTGDLPWELVYFALQTFLKLCEMSPDETFDTRRESLWDAAGKCVSYHHSWVKFSAAKLIGAYFAHFATTNAENGLDATPLFGSRGLQLTGEEMLRLTSASLRVFRGPSVSDELCNQSVRNLAFLARCFAVNGLKWSRKSGAEDEDDDVDDGAGASMSDEDVNGAEEIQANGADDEEEWSGCSPPPERPSVHSSVTIPSAIHYLLTRLIAVIRRETKIIRLPMLYPKTSVLQLIYTLCSILPVSALTPSLLQVLSPLLTLIDPATTVPRSTDPAFNDAYKALQDKAQEVMNVLQKRLGTTEYVALVQDVQRSMRERREGRRAKRRVEAVSMPEKAGKEKRRRQDVKRVKRKERGAENRGLRRGW